MKKNAPTYYRDENGSIVKIAKIKHYRAAFGKSKWYYVYDLTDGEWERREGYIKGKPPSWIAIFGDELKELKFIDSL